ncbi:hypothetical protein [Sphingomonas lycopersici]|uniref:Uncharacterized protein n=1 Tax=Sphingomonas lycopersici TaxID=2951807 RepID=A0AA41ZIP5_9SPHN|nr:hypothetical protein [Sphingomonas lycopersici]
MNLFASALHAALATASLGKAPSWTSDPPDPAPGTAARGALTGASAVSLPPLGGTFAAATRSPASGAGTGLAPARRPSIGASGTALRSIAAEELAPALVAIAESPSPLTLSPPGSSGLIL